MTTCNLNREAAARGNVTRHRQAQERAVESRERFERAVQAQRDGILEKHCEKIRDERGGIPLGLWAVVMKGMDGRDIGQALVSGHTELLEPVG